MAEEARDTARADGIVIRPCRPADRAAIGRLGHPPPVADILCPSPARRIAWRLLGARAVAVLAEDAGTGSVLGTVQFVRSRLSPNTWMFGHWRVVAARRRQGIGRRLLAEGERLLPEIGRLYSYVDWDNEVSIAAHEGLGFEAGRALWGSAPLGGLSTVGPATPSLRLEPVGARDWPVLFAIYARAMGSLWLRLFPEIGPRNFLGGASSGLRAGAVAVARGVPLAGRAAFTVRGGANSPDRSVAGFVLWEGAAATLFAEPDACDPAFLARAALQIVAQGARRDDTIELRGVPRSLEGRSGPIGLRVLMGMPDVRTEWRG